MKGREILCDDLGGRSAAALVVDGQLEDLIIDPRGDGPPRPGTIFRGVVDRPLKGQGALTLRLPEGRAFLRGAKGLSQGQSILVQVSSYAEAGKAVPVTQKLLFKGRSAIVTPDAPGINISRKLRDDDERMRLHDTATGALGDHPYGVILRSAAHAIPSAEIAAELSDLVAVAKQVLSDTGQGPERLFDGPTAAELAWRDWSDPEPDALDTEAGSFSRHGVLDRLPRTCGISQSLPGGASAYIEPTRALVAVDLNTGSDASPAAALKANLALAGALPRFLRLRGLGGQVVIDFAPLAKKDRRQIETVLRAGFRQDPVETALVGWTPLGHFELQRKRERHPIAFGELSE
ncbi:MAG: ribonuclease E/G [Pseudomonadota bacterium]